MRCRREFCECRETFPGTLEAVERFIADQCQRFLRRHRDDLAFAAELVRREVLVNAVEHGTRDNPDRTISCALRLRGNSLTIAVADQGPGFDWRAARGRQCEIWRASGRGLEILARYATRIRFNDKGNAVTIIKKL